MNDFIETFIKLPEILLGLMLGRSSIKLENSILITLDGLTNDPMKNCQNVSNF